MSDTEKKKRGRPAAKQNLLSHPLAHSLIKELLQREATNEECASRLMCSVRTWINWKNKHADFLHSLMKKDEMRDEEIERSLFMVAKGFTKTITTVEDGVTKVEEKYYPPNVAAQAFWLKNRQSQKWREKIDIAASMEQIPVRINFKRKEKVIEAESKKLPESQLVEGQGENSAPEEREGEEGQT